MALLGLVQIACILLCKHVFGAPGNTEVQSPDMITRERRTVEENSFLCTAANNEALLQLNWQNSIIPYSINKNLTGAAKQRIIRAMWQWERESCFIFVPRNSESQFVSFAGDSNEQCCIQSVTTTSTQCQLLHVTSCSNVMINNLIGNILGPGDTSQAPHDASTVNANSDSSDQDLASDQLNTSCRAKCGEIIVANTTTTNITQGVHEQGVIQTPNYPNYYPSYLDCTWKVRAPDGYAVRMRFEALNMEMSKNCMYDYLNISHLNIEGDIIRQRKLCATPSISNLNLDTMYTRKIDMETVAVVVHFHSDDTYAGKGFKLHYEVLDKKNFTDPCSLNNGGCDHLCISDRDGRHSCDCREGYSLSLDRKTCHDIDECEEKKGGCQHKCHNTEGSFLCSCRVGFRLNYDKRTCSACNYNLEDNSGYITSQHFPAPYAHMDNCLWTLTPWPNHRLKLTLHHLDILPSHKCKIDYLKLPNGHFPNQRRLCGHHFNITYVTDEAMTARFHSHSDNILHTGFKLSYVQVPEEELTELDLEYVIVSGTYVRYRQRHWFPVG